MADRSLVPTVPPWLPGLNTVIVSALTTTAQQHDLAVQDVLSRWIEYTRRLHRAPVISGRQPLPLTAVTSLELELYHAYFLCHPHNETVRLNKTDCSVEIYEQALVAAGKNPPTAARPLEECSQAVSATILPLFLRQELHPLRRMLSEPDVLRRLSAPSSSHTAASSSNSSGPPPAQGTHSTTEASAPGTHDAPHEPAAEAVPGPPVLHAAEQNQHSNHDSCPSIHSTDPTAHQTETTVEKVAPQHRDEGRQEMEESSTDAEGGQSSSENEDGKPAYRRHVYSKWQRKLVAGGLIDDTECATIWKDLPGSLVRNGKRLRGFPDGATVPSELPRTKPRLHGMDASPYEDIEKIGDALADGSLQIEDVKDPVELQGLKDGTIAAVVYASGLPAWFAKHTKAPTNSLGKRKDTPAASIKKEVEDTGQPSVKSQGRSSKRAKRPIPVDSDLEDANDASKGDAALVAPSQPVFTAAQVAQMMTAVFGAMPGPSSSNVQPSPPTPQAQMMMSMLGGTPPSSASAPKSRKRSQAARKN